MTSTQEKTHNYDDNDKVSSSGSNSEIRSSFKMSLGPKLELVSGSSKLVNKFEDKVSMCSSPSSKILTQTCDEGDDNMSYSKSGIIKIIPSLKNKNQSGGLNNSKSKLIHRKGKTHGKSQDIRNFLVSQSSAKSSQEEGGRSESEKIIIHTGKSSQTKISTRVNSAPGYKMFPNLHDHS